MSTDQISTLVRTLSDSHRAAFSAETCATWAVKLQDAGIGLQQVVKAHGDALAADKMPKFVEFRNACQQYRPNGEKIREDQKWKTTVKPGALAFYESFKPDEPVWLRRAGLFRPAKIWTSGDASDRKFVTYCVYGSEFAEHCYTTSMLLIAAVEYPDAVIYHWPDLPPSAARVSDEVCRRELFALGLISSAPAVAQ